MSGPVMLGLAFLVPLICTVRSSPPSTYRERLVWSKTILVRIGIFELDNASGYSL